MSSYKLLAAPKLTGCAITLTLTSSPGAREGYNPKPNLNPNPNPNPDPNPNPNLESAVTPLARGASGGVRRVAE